MEPKDLKNSEELKSTQSTDKKDIEKDVDSKREELIRDNGDNRDQEVKTEDESDDSVFIDNDDSEKPEPEIPGAAGDDPEMSETEIVEENDEQEVTESGNSDPDVDSVGDAGSEESESSSSSSEEERSEDTESADTISDTESSKGDEAEESEPGSGGAEAEITKDAEPDAEGSEEKLSDDQLLLLSIFGYPDEYVIIFDEENNNKRVEVWIFEAMQSSFLFEGGVYSSSEVVITPELLPDNYDIRPEEFVYSMTPDEVEYLVGEEGYQLIETNTGLKSIIYGDGSIVCTFNTGDLLVYVSRSKKVEITEG